MLNLYELDERESIIARRVYAQALKDHCIGEEEADVDVTAVSIEEIRELNNATRGVDRATDVLSFPSIDIEYPFDKADYPYDINPESGGIYIGEIIVCRDIMLEQAKEYNHSSIREFAYLVTHGMMHLLGYDHIEEEDRKIMRSAEDRVLNALGYDRNVEEI